MYYAKKSQIVHKTYLKKKERVFEIFTVKWMFYGISTIIEYKIIYGHVYMWYRYFVLFIEWDSAFCSHTVEWILLSFGAQSVISLFAQCQFINVWINVESKLHRRPTTTIIIKIYNTLLNFKKYKESFFNQSCLAHWGESNI